MENFRNNICRLCPQIAPSIKMIEHSAIPMSSPNFCLEASDSTCKDGLVAIARREKKKGVLKIVGAAGNVEGTCSLTDRGEENFGTDSAFVINAVRIRRC